MKTLEIKGLVKSFGKNRVLSNVDIVFAPGEIHALVGENGAGKSTILKILMGQFPFEGGSIHYGDEEIRFPSPFEARKNGFAMVYQELTLLREMSVIDNIFLGDQPVKGGLIAQKKQRERFEELLKQYDMDIPGDELVKNLPLSKQCMVEVLKVLEADPDVVIFDETTSALDNEEVEKLFRILRTLKSANKIILFISHRMDEIFAIADKVSVLKDGVMVATLPTQQLTHDSLIELMVGRTITEIFPQKSTPKKEVCFSVRSLSRKDGLISDISIDVRRGEIVGIAGLKGHGQDVLLDCIAGVKKYDGGTIELAGRKLKQGSARKNIKEGIILVPEERKTDALFLGHTIGRNLTVSSQDMRQRAGVIRKKAERTFVQKTIEDMEVKCTSSETCVAELSGGNQQKVVLGRVLGIQPRVILFNEPTRGIDVKTKQEIMRRLRQLADEGVVILLYSSDLLEVIGISNTVYTMYEGRITRKLEGDQINEVEIMRGIVGAVEG